MPHLDFRPLIHELMARDLSIASFMSELLAAHEIAYPQYDWGSLKAIGFDESDSLFERWPIRAFTREPPRGKKIKAFWCGLFQPIRDDGPVADMAIQGMKDFEIDQVPAEWHLNANYEPLLGEAYSRSLAELYRCAYREGGPGNDAEDYVGLGYAAKTVSVALARIDPELIFGPRKTISVAVGWNSGGPLYIGHIERSGFVPRPVAEAKAGLALQVTRRAEYELREEKRQRESMRRFRHPDGRVWSISVTEFSIELQFTDTDGEEHARKRFRTEVAEDMNAVAETLVDEQRIDGFVEVVSRP